jgi:hypothetical protein
MSLQTSRHGAARRSEPTALHQGAAENLRYIRSTMEAAHTFTTVPGKGCIAMGCIALAAAALDSRPALSSHWLAIWLLAACAAGVTALAFMAAKARAQGISLRRSVTQRFFLTLTPAFVAAAVLTAAMYDSVSRETVAALWLLLYGAGIASSGVYAIRVVWTAGLGFMALGAATLALPPGSAPVMLALGFGGIHLILGEVVRRDHGG